MTKEQRLMVETFARGGWDAYEGPCASTPEGNYLFPKAGDLQVICAALLAREQEVEAAQRERAATVRNLGDQLAQVEEERDATAGLLKLPTTPPALLVVELPLRTMSREAVKRCQDRWEAAAQSLGYVGAVVFADHGTRATLVSVDPVLAAAGVMRVTDDGGMAATAPEAAGATQGDERPVHRVEPTSSQGGT